MLLFPQGGERVLTRLVVLTVLRQKMRMGTAEGDDSGRPDRCRYRTLAEHSPGGERVARELHCTALVHLHWLAECDCVVMVGYGNSCG